MAKSEDLQLNIKVKGQDDVADLSDDIDDLFKKVDKLTSRPAELLLTSKFGKIEGEIADLTLKLEELDATDPEVEVTIARLNQLQGDLDAVVGKIKEVDAAKAEPTVTLDTSGVEGGLARTRGGIDEMKDSTRGANSALANMIGNTAQDLGEFGGIVGSVGVGIGQMAEYAADATLAGEGLGSSLASMAAVAGPIAALSLAMLGVQAAAKLLSGNQKELAENTREATEAFTDSVGVLDDWKAAVEDAFSTGTADDAVVFSKTVQEAMQEALSEDQFNQFVEALDTLGLTFENLNELVDVTSTNMGSLATVQLAAKGATAEQITRLQELIAQFGNADEAIIALQNEMSFTDIDNSALIQFIEDNKTLVDSLDEVGEAFDQVPLDEAARKFLLFQSVVDPTTRSMVQQATATATLRDGTVDYTKALGEFIRLQQEATREHTRQQQAVEDQITMWEAIGEAQRKANEERIDPRDSAEITRAFQVLNVELGAQEVLWERLVRDIKDGTLSTDNAVDAYNRLQSALHLTDKEMDLLLQQKVSEELEAEAEAADEAAQKLRDLSNAAIEASAAVNTTDFRASAIGEAFDTLNEFSGLETAEQLNAVSDAWDAIDQAAKDFPDTIVGIDLVPDSWEDVKNMPDDLQGVTDAIEQFRDAAQVKLAEAFEFGGPEAIRASAEDMIAQFEGPFRAMMERNGASVEETNEAWNQFLHDVGLAPEQIDMVVNLSIDEQKLQILKDLASGAGLAGERKLAFDIAIANKDPATALRILNEQLAGVFGQELVLTVNPDTGAVTANLDTITKTDYNATVTVEGDPEPFNNDVNSARVKQEGLPVTLKAQADTAKATADLDATRGDKTKGGGPRVATINAKAETAAAEGALNSVARARHTLISVLLSGALQAELALNQIARDRTADIFVQTHGAAAAQSAVSGIVPHSVAAPMTVGAPSAMPMERMTTTMVAPAAVTMIPAPITNNLHVTVQSAVVGNRYQTERVVAKAMRAWTRLNGSRN